VDAPISFKEVLEVSMDLFSEWAKEKGPSDDRKTEKLREEMDKLKKEINRVKQDLEEKESIDDWFRW
jgi:hypothetical protein